MPLISDPAHGTKFGLDGQREPTPAELEAAQAELGGGARLMKHCRQCRADAVGLLGAEGMRDHEVLVRHEEAVAEFAEIERISSATVDCPERSICSRVMTWTGATPSASVRLMFEPVTVTRSSCWGWVVD